MFESGIPTHLTQHQTRVIFTEDRLIRKTDFKQIQVTQFNLHIVHFEITNTLQNLNVNTF